MMDWLRRVLPRPVVRVLKAMRRPLRWHAQVRRLSGARAQREKARGEPYVSRRGIIEMGRRSPGPGDDWWDQRVTLAGSAHASDLRTLAYLPGRVVNPYLRLLYSRCPESGFDPLPLESPDLVFRLPSDSVVHLHWTRKAQVGASSVEDARKRSAAFLKPFEDFVGRGGTFVWTIHQALPHDCPYPEAEIELRARLAELAAGVHVLHQSTIDEVQSLYELDRSKVFIIEHPLYTGMYQRYVTRSNARAVLGLGDDEVLLLCFGAIRPYKGFDRMVNLLPRLRSDTNLDIRVMIAGPAFKSVEIAELERLVDSTDGASMSSTAVLDENVQVLFEAADAVILPYRGIMNSGVLMLGLTFGKPCVVPENAVTRDARASGLVHLFDSASDGDLERVIVEAMARRESFGGLPGDFSAKHDPTMIAGEFARRLAEIVAG